MCPHHIHDEATGATALTHVALSLRDHGPQDLAGLSSSLGLAPTTVAAALRELSSLEVIAPVGAAPAGPARGCEVLGLHRFTGDDAYVVAVDVGPHALRIAHCDLTGRILHRVDVPSDTNGSAAPRIQATVERVLAAQREAGIGRGRLWACTFAVPAPVDGRGRVMPSTLVPSWSGVDLAETVSEALDCPVHVANDATLSALAEATLGEGVGVKDMVNVCVGRRLSVRHLLDGRPREGADHLAGSVAHLFGERLDLEGRIAWSDEVDGTRVVRRALAGDRLAVEQVEEVVDGMGFGLAATILLENPECVVIGGSVGSLLGPWMGRLADGVHRHLRGINARVDLRCSSLGSDTVIAGALVMALEDATSALLGEHAPAALPRLREQLVA